MMTVITETTVKPGREADWDTAYAERAADARQQPGWVALHLLIPEDDPLKRIVVGTWQNRADWERWHATEAFQRTREKLNDATAQHGEDRWFRVVEQEAGGSTR
jgi:heme-degrading monooxygenase HmoA